MQLKLSWLFAVTKAAGDNGRERVLWRYNSQQSVFHLVEGQQYSIFDYLKIYYKTLRKTIKQVPNTYIKPNNSSVFELV